MRLIIINGLPGSGKTTLARPLAKELDLPLITKDSIKEFLFDELGVKDRAWSTTLGKVSNDFLYTLAATLLADKQSIMIENAFETLFARPRLQNIIKKYNPDVIEIYCHTDPATRRKRFIDRNESGLRHKGHVDEENYSTNDTPEPNDKYAPLGAGKLLKVDSTYAVDIHQLAILVRSS